jgi:hypothetical protein
VKLSHPDRGIHIENKELRGIFMREIIEKSI